jgi:hypothetical protein
MKHRTRVVLQVAALCLMLGAFAFAADDAHLYIVNGVPGRDINKGLNPGYPIDVLVNGESCQSRGLTFGSSSGPLSFSAGTYAVEVSESNTLAPCTNPVVIAAQVTLQPGANISLVAAVSAGKRAPLQFNDNLSPVTAGNARFVFANAADAPALQATLMQLNVKNPKTFTVTANPGKQQAISIPGGTYSVQVVAAGNSTVLASEVINLPNQSATFTYAAGEATDNVLGLINRAVEGVF